MMNTYFIHAKTVACCILVLAMAACASTESARFYALSSSAGSISESTANNIPGDITIGIGPISIPDYIDRPEIVTRNNQNEMTLAEFDRWAGDLEESVSNIISENLSILLSTDRIAVYPWKGSLPIDYQVEADVVQFDGTLGGSVTLIARWRIIQCSTKELLVMKKSKITESAGAQSYEAMVAAQSRALSNLSREISIAIGHLSQ